MLFPNLVSLHMQIRAMKSTWSRRSSIRTFHVLLGLHAAQWAAAAAATAAASNATAPLPSCHHRADDGGGSDGTDSPFLRLRERRADAMVFIRVMKTGSSRWMMIRERHRRGVTSLNKQHHET